MVTDTQPTPQLLDEPRASALTVRYAPDNEEVWENPPRFVWLPTLDENSLYVLQVATDAHFAAAATRLYPGIARNFFTPETGFAPGQHRWRYAVWDAAKCAPASGWSQVRNFTVPASLEPSPLPGGDTRLRNASKLHPRLWLGPGELTAFATALETNPDHCQFAKFFERSVKPWIDAPIRTEPARYPGDKKTAVLWRQIYIACQEVVYAIRHGLVSIA